MTTKTSKPKSPDITLRPIRVNLGVEAAYRKKLQDLLAKMTDDLLRTITKVYQPVSTAIVADAADPVVVMRKLMTRFDTKWTDRFEDMAVEISELFATRSQRNLDATFRRRLKEAGFTVRFRPTKRMVSAYRAVVAQNVNLISNIPQQYVKDLQTVVWQNVMKGGDLYTMSRQLRQKHGIAHRRAAFIATDQNAKARAIFESVRDQELGIEKGIWRHSSAGKKPRPTHVAMNGKTFKIKDGMYDSEVGHNVQPGELPRCRCTYSPIISGFEA